MRTSGSKAAVATNLSYPLADLTMIALVVCVLAVSGWRIGRAWAFFAAGLLVFSVSDCLYLFQTAVGSYVAGGATDLGWVGGCVLLAWAAWQPSALRPCAARRLGSARRPDRVRPACARRARLRQLPSRQPALARDRDRRDPRRHRTARDDVRGEPADALGSRTGETDVLTGLGNRRASCSTTSTSRSTSRDRGRPRALRPQRLQAVQRHLRASRRRRAAARLGEKPRSFVAATEAPTGWAATSSASSCPTAPTTGLDAGAACALADHGDGFAITRRAARRPSREAPTRGRAAARRPAHVRAQARRTRVGQGAVERRAPACAGRVSPEARRARCPVSPSWRTAGRELGLPAADSRSAARGRAARRRQDGDPRRDPREARPARPRTSGSSCAATR